jgi:hypothetical protein
MRLYTLPAVALLSLVAVPAQAAASSAATVTATTLSTAPSPKNSAHAREDISLPPSAVPPFAEADRNHDGKIEWSEAKALKVPKKLFEHDDFDNNGTLDETEWMFVRLDMTVFTPPTRAKAATTHY